MINRKPIYLIYFLIAIIFIYICCIVYFHIENEKLFNADPMSVSKRAVILDVNESYIQVAGLDEESNFDGLYNITLTNELQGEYKLNQEILIYYSGTITTTNPGSFQNIGKIEIIKENTDIKFPNNM